MKRAALGLLLAACGPPAKTPPPPVPLHLERACDVAPSAGLAWIVEAEPRAIAQEPELIPAIAMVVPEARFALFARTHGEIDVRQIRDLCVARYKDATLAVAKVPLDPAKVEKAFGETLSKPAVRSIDAPNPVVLRASGDTNGAPEQLVLFGSQAVLHEQGRGAATRAAEAFALGKLKRAQPALRGAALARARELVGEAPFRAFAPGPFEGELGQGLGGLLRAATAVAVSVKPAGSKLQVRFVMTGAWGADADAAAERLAAAVHVVSESGVAHLLGLNRPLSGPVVRGSGEALTVEATYDANALAKGLHDALDAEVGEIFGR